MNVKKKHKLCIKIYKTLNNLSPSFMKKNLSTKIKF